MFLLGDSSADRGQQLEVLTRRLLEAKGYVNCNVNLIAGGSEIDVQAEYSIPTLSGGVRYVVICECKAHQRPIDMTEWCKFLGKLFHYEKTKDDRYVGCFIALSGVNGYVQGHFDSLKLKADKVQLLAGDSLAEEVVRFYKAQDRANIFARLNACTQRIITQLEIGIHRDRLFWVVGLSDTEFTVVGGDGTFWRRDSSTEGSIELLSKALDGSSFVDLNEEARLIQRQKDVASALIAILIAHGGDKVSLDQLPAVLDFTKDEFARTAKDLHDKGVIEYWAYNEKARIPFKQRNGSATISLEAWRTLCDGQVTVQVKDNNVVDDLVNNEFLDEVSRLQGDLPIPVARREIWLKVLPICRDAIKMLVNPIPMVMQHRKEPGPESQRDEMNKMDITLIERSIIDLLMYDYRKPSLGKFFQKRDIYEIETTRSLKIKTDKEVFLEFDINERFALAELADSHGGGFVPVLLVPSAPQPWEAGGLVPKHSSEEKK